MNIINIPTERTTALTDFILGLIIVTILIALFRIEKSRRVPKLKIWLRGFGLLGFASFVGSIVHGIAMSSELHFWLWQPLNLALGLVIAMFVIATAYDIWGEAAYQKVQIPLIGVAIIFYGITVLVPGTFLIFIAYEAIAMLFALAGYSYLAFRKRLAGAWWMVVGILLTIIAAAIQAIGRNGVVIFLGLDHNGVFHLIQICGILALTIGLQKSIIGRATKLQRAVV